MNNFVTSRYARGGLLYRRGVGIAAGIENPRDELVYGTYMPNDLQFVGADVSKFTGQIGAPGDGNGADFTVTANNQIVQNLDIYGSIKFGSFTGVQVINCRTWGTQARGGDTSSLNAQGDDFRGAVITDCTITQRAGDLHNEWCSVARGGGYTMQRCDVNNHPDGLVFTSRVGNANILGNWLHDGWYQEWVAAEGTTSSGVREYTGGTVAGPRPFPKGYMPYAPGSTLYTHSDGIQFARGKNYVIRGNYIGGVYVNGEHNQTPSQIDTIRQGKGWYNSCILLKQEVSSLAIDKIENVVIDRNWFEGSKASFNWTYGNGNDFESAYVTDNKFVRQSGYPTTQSYILRGQNTSTGVPVGNLSGSTFTDNGAAVPITRGN